MLKVKLRLDIISTLAIALIIVTLGTCVLLTPINAKESVAVSVYRSSEKGVSLTFNVYQNTECVVKILDVLSSYGVSATFFLGGTWVKKNQDAVRALALTQEIGSHGYYHYDHKSLTKAQNVEEIKRSIQAITDCADVTPTLFAPPSGSYGDECLQAAEELGLRVVLWSKDTIDWRDQDAELIFKRATEEVRKGDFILMHPTPATVEALPHIIESILSKGLQILTVGENLGV